jgi:hypothetical protein
MLWACTSTLYSVWCAVYPQIAYAKNSETPRTQCIITSFMRGFSRSMRQSVDLAGYLLLERNGVYTCPPCIQFVYTKKQRKEKKRNRGEKAMNSAGYPTILTSRTSTVAKHVTYKALTPENQEKKTSYLPHLVAWCGRARSPRTCS